MIEKKPGARMTCPVCGLENPERVVKCDCGFNFDARKGGTPVSFWRRYRAPIIIVGPFVALLLSAFLLWQLLTHFLRLGGM